MDTPTPNNAIEDLADEAGDAASDAARKLGDKASNWVDKAHTCIDNNPLTSVLIAAGIGLLAGYLLCGRGSKQG